MANKLFGQVVKQVEKALVFCLLVSSLCLVFVVFVSAKEVYKQQSGETKVTLVILPAKKIKKEKDNIVYQNLAQNPIRAFNEWLSGLFGN